ncbi:hypothetical protein SEUCBS139899_003736 [Sporothrix eucalyptigena]|uniref:YokE-like PH domain-containing protein n=1 Tax=Sporothrix eucalyptigena TaxID=1812306 RepID=A0ABP0BQD8_9PEZI
MSEVYSPDVVGPFNARGDRLRENLQRIFDGSRLCVTGRGSLLCVHATRTGLKPNQITCKDDVSVVEDGNLKRLFWLEMLQSGFWVTLRGSLAMNLPLSDEALDAFVEAVAKFCAKYQSLIAVDAE